MRRQFVLGRLAWLLCACSVPTVPAAEQSPSAAPQPSSAWPVELWGSVDAATLAGKGRLDSRYPLTLANAPESEGQAAQALTLDPTRGFGFEVGANVMPARHVGAQVFAANARGDLAGANTPYRLDLRYVSRQPPDYQSRPYELHQSIEWPDTTGRLVQWSFGAGPVVRARAGRVSVTASGGIAWLRLSGHAAPLGFNVVRLGGHSTLFSDEFRVRASLGPTTTTGGYLGGALDVPLGRRVGLLVGIRGFLVGDVELPAHVEALVDQDAAVGPPSLADIDDQMSLGPARLTPYRLLLTVGLRVR